jgi:hypothetical protein
MKYPASKYYKHLDPSEPIPEIELRYDEYKLHTSRYLVRTGPYMIAAGLVLGVLLFVVSAPWLLRLLVFMLYLAIDCFLIFRYGAKHSTSRERKLRGKAGDTWGIPVALLLKAQAYSLGIIAVMMIATSSELGPMQAVFYVSFYALGGGIIVAIASRMFREPGQICCARCSYPLIGLRVPCECPECGFHITTLADATDRPRVRDNRYLILGIAIVALGCFGVFVRIASPTWAYGPIPNALLIKLAPNDTGTFDALLAKSLTPADEDKLEASLIEAIHSGNTAGFWSHAQGAWLANRAFNGDLVGENLDALMKRVSEVRIQAPDSVSVGTALNIRLRADETWIPSTDLNPVYFFGGYLVGTDSTDHMRQSSPKGRYALVRGEDTTESKGIDAPMYRFIPDEAGRVTVRARVVWVLYPTFPQAQLCGFAWGNDDSFSFVNPPLWSRVIDLEHTIEVTE